MSYTDLSNQWKCHQLSRDHLSPELVIHADTLVYIARLFGGTTVVREGLLPELSFDYERYMDEKIITETTHLASMLALKEMARRSAKKTLILYHATNDTSASSILKCGIDLSMGMSNLDFNSNNRTGFYVTGDLKQAVAWTQWRMRREGGIPAIVVFCLCRSNLDRLNGISFPNGNFAWKAFVSSACYNRLYHDYDFVEGPMWLNQRRWPMIIAGHQIGIFSANAVEVFQDAITSVEKLSV